MSEWSHVFIGGGLEVSTDGVDFLLILDDDADRAYEYLDQKTARQMANAVLAWANQEETPGG